jgi:hypothetical protein
MKTDKPDDYSTGICPKCGQRRLWGHSAPGCSHAVPFCSCCLTDYFAEYTPNISTITKEDCELLGVDWVK